MTRYIDADWLIKGIDIEIELTDIVEAKKVADAFNEIISRIKNTPTADVVEVVRCKDCKYKGGNGYDEDVCWEIEPQHGVYVSDNWYCADGERRE